jgi:hypothetical protein
MTAGKTPIDKVDPPKVDKTPKDRISMENIELLETCDKKTFLVQRVRAKIRALVDSGLRQAEFMALNNADVIMNNGSVKELVDKAFDWIDERSIRSFNSKFIDLLSQSNIIAISCRDWRLEMQRSLHFMVSGNCFLSISRYWQLEYLKRILAVNIGLTNIIKISGMRLF